IASRCASTTTVWFGSPPLDSAITFQSVRGSWMSCTSMLIVGGVALVASLYRLLPVSNDVNTTGTVATNGLLAASTMLPLNTAVRPGWPSLKMITPDAPAFCALITFVPNVHVPRWISAMLPAVNPLKSLGSQPLAESGLGSGG